MRQGIYCSSTWCLRKKKKQGNCQPIFQVLCNPTVSSVLLTGPPDAIRFTRVWNPLTLLPSLWPSREFTATLFLTLSARSDSSLTPPVTYSCEYGTIKRQNRRVELSHGCDEVGKSLKHDKIYPNGLGYLFGVASVCNELCP